MYMQTYDVTNQLACLEAVWVSKAAAKQRKGRAGRSELYNYVHVYMYICVPVPPTLYTCTCKCIYMYIHCSSQLFNIGVHEICSVMRF